MLPCPCALPLAPRCSLYMRHSVFVAGEMYSAPSIVLQARLSHVCLIAPPSRWLYIPAYGATEAPHQALTPMSLYVSTSQGQQMQAQPPCILFSSWQVLVFLWRHLLMSLGLCRAVVLMAVSRCLTISARPTPG